MSSVRICVEVKLGGEIIIVKLINSSGTIGLNE